MLQRIGWKARRQVLKDYVLWPVLAGPVLPLDRSPPTWSPT